MNSNIAGSSFWKRTGMLAATIFVSHMAFTSSTFSPVAQAQPDLNNAPKADNPPPRNRPNRGGRGDNENRRSPEENVRMILAQAGVNDAATQTAVLDYIKADIEARSPLREQGKSLLKALQAGAVTDDQLLALVTDYRAAQQAEKARRERAQADLDAKINYSKNPRLEAILLLTGLIGDGPMMFQGGRGGPGERGGRGGQPGPRGQENAANREERQKRMLERFDTNKDGKLDDAERAAMQAEREKRREQRQNGGKPDAAPAAMPDQGDA
jgi:hypothetical protein